MFLVDFGRVAFGNLLLGSIAQAGDADLPTRHEVKVRFGEALKNGRVDTHPPGSVRYAEVKVTLKGSAATRMDPPPDAHNTKPPAVLTPPGWGVFLPFRWVEIEGWPGELRVNEIRRLAAFDSTWNDDAAALRSSDETLNQIWDLCHYTIKATTFAGVFVDGDRERLAYEADAYLTQLSYYAGNADPRMVRATFDRLMEFPTWPTEWAPHMVFIAYADWMQTGDTTWLAAHYEGLKTKLLDERAGPDGLVTSTPEQIQHGDIVDWPVEERDQYVFTHVNTVVNAFHLRALREMSELAGALGKKEEAAKFAERERSAEMTFQRLLFDPVRGLYRDGVGTDHASEHANLFPLAFGIVPASRRQEIAHWLAERGMAVSVYAAQYLLEGLFENGEDTAALSLIGAAGDRSWRHMVESGTTITWEAWDQKYKPNQDWNHAWGAAPANLLPRFVLGVRVLKPGWSRALIQPHPGTLVSAEGRVPTPRGEVLVGWRRGKIFSMALALPPGVVAKVELPALPGSRGVWASGKKVTARRSGQWWVLENDVSGQINLVER
ncbi:Alfa-L-rhamnosidase [Acidisarcina polymorpha]|uniref:alpha-L-rhamnosidase n=1 Tax=Acidisarcina polymorpha TaxID=2211140 RepID=A0A2Z5G2S2_9BACT|nr:Alfa-L-rhamnosidase [Acidisarcina polymorpha]